MRRSPYMQLRSQGSPAIPGQSRLSPSTDQITATILEVEPPTRVMQSCTTQNCAQLSEPSTSDANVNSPLSKDLKDSGEGPVEGILNLDFLQQKVGLHGEQIVKVVRQLRSGSDLYGRTFRMERIFGRTKSVAVRLNY
ncbi:hypothetical protein BaRGS_00025618 [Batillaria attramentaria]|uniref:Uncharacterized protein n=1 Tax=Batillaria attramentaria TaxID=370345 RepID=A0ABD0K7V4_9CAEN